MNLLPFLTIAMLLCCALETRSAQTDGELNNKEALLGTSINCC